MAGEEDIAWGVTLTFTPNGGSAVELGELYNLSPPNLSRDKVDATKLNAPGRWRQAIKGMKEGGDITFAILMDTSAETRGAAFKALRDDLSTQTIGTVALAWDDGTEMSMPAFVTGLQPMADPSDVRKAEITMAVAGQITWTDTAA